MDELEAFSNVEVAFLSVDELFRSVILPLVDQFLLLELHLLNALVL
ncbi:MAG: hypothetical protein J07AB43_08530 [Candidatus Nanosalina sp. J07AB43]|nr:MAG: hypothetical protein J07AB43_08530 [Candidatus Nanosalina sp. J07AB43]